MGAELNRMAADMAALNEFVDKRCAYALRFAKEKDKLEPTCERGCTACCYMTVTASLVEAICAMRGAHLHAAEVGSKMDAIKADFMRLADTELTTGQWLLEQRPCALLLKTGDCAAYAWRPHACRSYYVFTPKERCAPPPSQSTLVANTRDLWFERAVNELTRISHAAQLPLVYAPLPFLVPLAMLYIDSGLEPTMDILKAYGMDTDEKAIKKMVTHWARLEL